jgi:hypothetical protein
MLDEWEKLLKADGAETTSLWLQGHVPGGVVYQNPDEPRELLDEWSRLVDCALVGLGH